MADIRLAKPAAGTTQTVPSAPNGRFIFDFPADAATLTRNGDDLVLTFEDGSSIRLQGFYTTYSKEEMPSFQVEGVEISGQDFFAALGEDLMPAAGPAAGSSAARGGRYNEYGGSDLLDGIDHLGRLDIGFDGGTQLATDTVEPSPYSEVDHGVTVTPSGVGAATEVVTVYEAGLAGGSQAGEKDAPTMARGSLSINAPDGVASIVIGGVVVFENGALTGKGVSTDEGTLSVTGYDPATGKLDFSYSLDRNTTEHVKSDPDTDTQISHTLVVTVTDTDGDSGSTTITVNVVDDAPTAVDDTVIGEEAQAQQGVVGDVLENDKTGADGLPNAVTSVKHGDEESMAGSALKGAYGELTLNADGTYTYKLDKNVDVEKGKSVTETFTYTITDADGDTSEATLTITIRGDEKEPVAPGEDKAEIVVDEGALSDGSGQHAEHGILGKDSFTVNLNGEDGTVTLKYGSGEDTSTITLSLINGENFTSQWLSENKTLTVNGVKVTVTDATQETPGGPWKIEYTYELTGQQAHKNAGSAGAVGEKDPLSDSIDITVTDATGDMTTGSLMVTVHDDGPVLTVSSDPNDTLEWTDGATGAYTTESGSLTLETGADGLKADSLKVTDAADPSKSATFDAEGKATIVYEDDSRLEATYDASTGQIVYTYTPGAATQTTDRSFMFSALDTDDDSASATVSIKVDLADSGDVPATVPSIEVDESGLADGTTPDPGMITKSITLPEGYTLNTDGWVAGEDGALTLTVNDGKGLLTYKDGELTYTLQGNYAHADATNPNEGLSDKPTFDLNLTHDATGVEVSTTVTVDVLDDAPVLTAKIDTQPGNDKGYYYDTDAAIVFRLAEGGSTTKLSDIDFGADVGTGEEGSAPARITVTVNNTTTFTVTVTRDAGGQLHFSGENSGTITFDKTGAATGADDGSKLTYDTATGQFTYTRLTADVGGTANEYTFTLTVTDADGDTVQQTGSVVTVFREPTITGDAGTTSSTVTTDEGNLEQGSDWEIDATEDYGTTASGTLTVNLDHADGTIQIGSLIIGVDKDGNVVSVNSNPATSLDGETVPGDHGHLSNITVSKADADGTITISYDYTLTEAVDGDAAEAIGDNTPGRGESMQADSFAVTVTANGHTATGSITANALDDAPVLTAFWMDAQSSDTDSSIHGQLDFVFGADAAGATLTVEVGGTTFTGTKHGSEWTFTSQNAKPGEDFRMNADGIFTYSRPTADVQDHKADSYTFNVTVTDGDGDSVSQSMTVTTTEVEPDVSDHTDLVVNEDGLVHDNNSETATGQLVVDLHGQSGTVTIGSVTVTVAADGTVSLPEDVVAEGSYGNLTITNVDTADGKTTIDYSYTLDTLYTHKDDEGNPTSEVKNGDTFKVQVNEKDTGTITVDIIDDVPVLEVTDNALTATGGYASESDTLTLDYGADAPTGSTLTVNGAQGTAGQNGSGQATLTFTLTNGALVLTQMSDHTYTYVYTAKNNTELDFSKGSLSENLTFEITDADGDTSSQTVTVTINAPSQPVVPDGVAAVVDEANIVDSSEGDITNIATVNVTELFGADSGYTIVNAELASDSPNEVTFTSDGLTYTLHERTNGGKVTDGLSDAESERQKDTTPGESITVTVQDEAGNQFTVEVPVKVIDDVPTISVTDKALTATGGYASESDTLTLDYGADVPAGSTLTVNGTKGTAGQNESGQATLTFTLTNGTLVLTQTSEHTYTYVYTAKDNTELDFSQGSLSDNLTFEITDADGDTSSQTVTVTINAPSQPVVPDGVAAVVDEANIVDSSEGDITNIATVNVTELFGADSGYTIVNAELASDSPNEVTFTSDGLTYTLHERTNGGKVTDGLSDAESERQKDTTPGESITVTVQDEAGNQFTVEVPVKVIDDVPTISVTEQASGAYGSTVTGSVDIDFGADGADDEKAVTVSLNGETVTGVKDSDGKYTFTFEDGHTITLDGATGEFSYNGVPSSGKGTEYEFTFTVTDADGDTATATTTAEILPKASYTGTVSSSDNDLLQTVRPSHAVDVSDMPGIREITDGTKVYQGETLIGEFTFSGGKLFFQQNEAYSHETGSESVTLAHQLTVTDVYGKEHIVAVDITIGDSDPYAHNDTFELKERGEGEEYDAEGNVLENDTRSADGPTLVTEVDGQPIGNDFKEIKGDLGILYIRSDGSYQYVLDEGVSIPDNSIRREEFTYTITDADGDTSTAAALTILVGKGTVHVKESGIGVDENGKEIPVYGNDTATGHVEGTVESVEFGSTQYSGDIPAEYVLKHEGTDTDGNTTVIHTNYGDLRVHEDGTYRFELKDNVADPLPEGFEIHQGFNFTTTVDGVTAPQEVVVVIEGTNDAGRLSEAGDGGHTGGNLWIDAKAEGADSVEVPYHAKDHPNLGNTDSGDHSSDLDQDSGGTARPTAWLPFTLEDLDFGDSLTFQAVYTGVNNDASGTSSMEGENFVSYVDLLKGMESDPLSVALSVEWGKFQQNFSAEQLGKMQFYRNEYGIFAITSDAVDLEKLTHQEGAQYWLTFLADSDHDVFRQMAEGRTNNSDNGMILHFSFQVKDKTGNTVQTSTGSDTYVNTNNVLVHVYGSNDTPEVELKGGSLVVHDDDVSTYSTEQVWQNGKWVTISKGDPESHTITVTYNGKTYTGTLDTGTVTLWADWQSITCNVKEGDGSGTNFIISNFNNGYSFINGQLAITITDGRGNSAMYMVNAQSGQLVDIPGGFTLTGTNEAENLYGGSDADTLWGGGGNDSLWGGEGNDTLEGGAGNDRLYGESGDDELQGGDGLDILVGGDGNDQLDGGDGNDVLIGDGQGDLQSVIEDTVNAETFRDFLSLKSPGELESYMSKFETQGDGNDTLEGGDGNDLLFGMGGNDQLDGGDGNDLLFGGSGDDYIDGGEGRDTIYAGDGNDIIVYDSNDYLVSGGSGIDFMVSDDSTLSLTKLLQGTGDGNGPIVDSIEVLITGKDALSLTSLEQMAKDYGISINGSSLELDSTLWAKADNGYRFTGDLDNDRTPDDLFLQVNSQTDAHVSVELVPSDDIAEAVQRAEIEHSNG